MSDSRGSHRKMSATQRGRLRERVWNRDNGTCWLCHKPVTLDEMTLDHEIPRVLGGKGGANLRAAHARCNNKRGAPGFNPAPASKPRPSPPKKRSKNCKLCNSHPCLGGCMRSGMPLHHITNDNAADFLAKLAAQKQDEDRQTGKAQ